MNRRQVLSAAAAGTAVSMVPKEQVPSDVMAAEASEPNLTATSAVSAALGFLHSIVADDAIELQERMSAAYSLADLGIRARDHLLLNEDLTYRIGEW